MAAIEDESVMPSRDSQRPFEKTIQTKTTLDVRRVVCSNVVLMIIPKCAREDSSSADWPKIKKIFQGEPNRSGGNASRTKYSTVLGIFHEWKDGVLELLSLTFISRVPLREDL